MDSQTDRLFNSAVERLPGPLGAALKAAELVDPCTLRFHPRWSYEQLLEKGIGRGSVAGVVGTCGTLGTGMGVDTGMRYCDWYLPSFLSVSLLFSSFSLFFSSFPSFSPCRLSGLTECGTNRGDV